jgi:hypothetical protein
MNPILREIADFMSNHNSGSAIDPLSVRPSLLPYLYILEAQKDDSGRPHLRVRLTGTALDRAFGRSLRGRHMEDFLHGPSSREVLAGFHACARDHAPLWMRQVVEIRDGPARYVEGVAFFVEPNLIYGGLVLGEVVGDDDRSGFESALL